MQDNPGRPAIEAATLSERAAALVEQDILAGTLAPGSRLGIVDLVQRYEIGATPLREGLSRLMSRGLIVSTGQRGFRVADISRTDLLDITQMRTAVEIEAVRLAITHGDDAWKPASSVRCTRCAATSNVPVISFAKALKISTGCTRAFTPHCWPPAARSGCLRRIPTCTTRPIATGG